eukprot:GHVR01028819.1.p1 GENE.GHVR01028819.1~~GHVR01028819.1.p1  ORF type:complete len:165 (+),score=12.99 GHVR01028819.1:77-571(+)
MCCGSVARSYPINIICLFAFTATEGLLVGGMCLVYDLQAVGITLLVTSVVVAVVTIFAFTTDIDFTKYGSYLMVACLGFFAASMVLMLTQWFMPVMPLFNKLLAAGGAVLFSVYLVYDVQLVVGGKHHSYQLEVDEYVFACMLVYMDIIQIFLYLLQLFGDSNN